MFVTGLNGDSAVPDEVVARFEEIVQIYREDGLSEAEPRPSDS